MVPKICSIPECERPFSCKSYCAMHYQRFKRHGDPLVTKVLTKKMCPVDGCEKMQHAKGYCYSHMYRNERYGNPLIDGPGRHSGRKRMDVPSYDGMHKRLFRDRGKASQFKCVDCGGQAQEWSYDGGCPDELYEIKEIEPLAYSTDQSRYSPRCKPCHRVKDDSCARGRDKAGRFASGPEMT